MNNDLETVTAVANATEEVAKAGNKAIDASIKFGGFISQYIHGTLEQGIGIFEDKLRYMRWERQLRLMKRAEQLMSEYGIEGPSHAIPMRTAIPLFQAASLEEDDYLQDKWARLLINASNDLGVDVKRSYVSILEELSYLDVKNLDMIYSFTKEECLNNSVCTDKLPDEVSLIPSGEYKTKVLDKEIEISMATLARLGLINGTFMLSGHYNYSVVYFTILGHDFIESCRISPIKR